ncbi:MAG: hypothetical protein ACYC8T_16155 [Myxococcaceae bacterium]
MFALPRLSLPVMLLLMAGCGRIQDWNTVEGADEADLAQSESALVAGEAEVEDDGAATCTSLTPEALAQRAADRAAQRFSPSSCVSAVAQGAIVTYQLSGCSGRFGAAEVSGTMVVTFSQEADGLHVTASGTGLQARRATFDLQVTGVCQRAGALRNWTVTSVADGTGFRGAALSHRGAYQVVVDRENRCAEVDGTWTNSRARASRTVTISDLSRCAGQCPAAGGTVQVQRFNGETVLVEFDGSSTANWSDSSGNVGSRSLRCGP